MAERRLFVRYDSDIHTNISLGNKKLEGIISDISVGGINLSCSTPLPNNKMVQIRIYLDSEEFYCTGLIVFSIDSKGKTQQGISFTPLFIDEKLIEEGWQQLSILDGTRLMQQKEHITRVEIDIVP